MNMTQHQQLEILTPSDVAEMLGISAERVLQYAREGRLAHVRKGRYYFFARPDVERFNEEHPRRPGRPPRE